jgi:hypothetical protein
MATFSMKIINNEPAPKVVFLRVGCYIIAGITRSSIKKVKPYIIYA